MKKQTWGKLNKIAKTLWAIIFGFATVVYIITAFVEDEMRTVFIVLAVIFGFLTFLLARKKKSVDNIQPPVVRDAQITPELGLHIETQYLPDVPEETLKDMRRYYTEMQASNDARIFAESFQLCQQTVNFETFSSRLELAQQKALTLLQARRAKCKCINNQTVSACIKALDAVPALKIDFLYRVCTKEMNAAMLLKTPSGQRRRLEALLEELEDQELFFMSIEDAYRKMLAEVRAKILQTEKAGEVQ